MSIFAGALMVYVRGIKIVVNKLIGKLIVYLLMFDLNFLKLTKKKQEAFVKKFMDDQLMLVQSTKIHHDNLTKTLANLLTSQTLISILLCLFSKLEVLFVLLNLKHSEN